MPKVYQTPHVVAVPFPALGHSIPFLELANHLASHGLTVSYVTTPANVCRLQHHVAEAVNNGLDIRLVVLPTPAVEGLPEGQESADLATPETAGLIHQLVRKLQQPFHTWMERQFQQETLTGPPVCVIHDMFIGWAVETVQKYNIASVLFNTCGAFAINLLHSVSRSILQEALEKEGEDRVVVSLDLPRPQRFHTHEICASFLKPDLSIPNRRFILEQFQAITKGCGLLVNTFSELEPRYLEDLKNLADKPVWAVGPLLPPNFLGGAVKVNARGKMADISEEELVRWLDSQNPRSVVYVSFGSHVSLSQQQTNALARGLEASGQPFVWAIKLPPETPKIDLASTYLPEGFLERTKNRGLVIWGWAPQLVILSHPSVAAFLSHCGWNSTLESITLGIPIIAWPMYGDQFFNVRLLAELGIGIQFCQHKSEIPNAERVEEVVRLVLTEDEGKELRKTVQKFKEIARKAVGNDGSSATNLKAFVTYLYKLNLNAEKNKIGA